MSEQHPLNEELITESAGKQRTGCMSPPLSIDGTDRRTDGHPSVTQTLTENFFSIEETIEFKDEGCRSKFKIIVSHDDTAKSFATDSRANRG